MRDIARTMQEREQAFEAQYKMMEERNFKIRSRRDHIFGHWVADKLGLHGDDATKYAQNTMFLDIELGGSDFMVQTVHQELHSNGKNITCEDLYNVLQNAFIKAYRSYDGEFPTALDRDHKH
jgi:hypothetical protein